MEREMQDQPDLANMSESDLLERIASLKTSKKLLEDNIKLYESEILFRNDELIKQALKEKDEPFGTVRVGDLKFNVPKSVIWDQEKLGTIYKEIVDHGDDPLQYMAVNYKVKESAFKGWPDALQDAFIDARTVKAGTIKLIVDGGEE